MNLVSKEIEKYCTDHSDVLHPALKKLERETYLKTLAPQMMSGPLLGRFLNLLTTIKQPKRILEIGTFTGYSTICFALALPEKSHLDTIEINEEMETIIRKYLVETKVSEQVNLIIGDALQVLPTLDQKYDMALIDAGKLDYANFFDMILPKMNMGGLILVDNTLWSGKLIEPALDIDSKNMQSFNEKLFTDPRVDTSLLPLRDGITVARKII